MNPGSEYQPPTTPYQVPGRPFEPQGPPPTVPSMQYMPPPGPPPGPPRGPLPPPRSRRPAWLLPALAAALVVLVAAGGVGAFLVYGKVSGTGAPAKTGEPSSSQAAAGVGKGPDVCAMLPKEEVDRLVPEATVAKSSRESDATVTFTCNWVNRRISFGEFWRGREIDVRIEQWKGEGARTGRSIAQGSHEIDYGSAKYGETAKPTLDPGQKMYVSPVKDIPGVGEGAFAQYTWNRDGKLLWYAFGKAYARVGDMTIELRYQADQQRKDAQILSNETVQAITEENAIREVSGLIGHFAKGAAAWQAKNPGVLAQPEPSQSAPAASSTPTPSPSVLPSFPADCAALTETASRLVPEPATRARATTVGADNQTECRWLNRELPGGPGITKIRSALITVHRFTNRAGGVDEASAKGYYESEYGGDRNMAQSSMAGITWGKVANVDGLGEQAYRQFIQTRRGEVSASSGTVLMRKGAVVVRVDYSGHQRPEGEPTNSPKVKFMTEKDAVAGALTLARAYMAELEKQPVGG
ncbi:hypothetical protein ETD86_31065 [Nonomuraea turkmeniaca]|uniref:DUF3558 domain-containing protein n=1 Tax=Nonomuraea turkmeniaca TaxID=103838 RepID=A0A5S4F8X5_9ACTN|nr:hypothetical protein [Nonomuraea turkmeniaca]TMR13244.1 hypothetical protein ETD86_31065 [Nonomuraea turkmeniaca]